MDQKLVRIDNVLWQVTVLSGRRTAIPICPKHHLRMSISGFFEDRTRNLYCEECPNSYVFIRDIQSEKKYVLNKIDSRQFKKMDVLNIDDEAIPLAKDEIRETDNPFWVEAKLVKSKSGKRLVVYAGEKNKKNKTQIFVEPEIKRLSFDHKDHHPSEVFVKLEAKFEDGTISTISNDK